MTRIINSISRFRRHYLAVIIWHSFQETVFLPFHSSFHWSNIRHRRTRVSGRWACRSRFVFHRRHSQSKCCNDEHAEQLYIVSSPEFTNRNSLPFWQLNLAKSVFTVWLVVWIFSHATCAMQLLTRSVHLLSCNMCHATQLSKQLTLR